MIHANSMGITPRDIPVTQKQFNDLAAIVAEKTKLEFVDELPETGDPTVIYCVMSTSAETGNLYDEYIWKDNAWEQISSEVRQVDLENYYTKNESDGRYYTKTQVDTKFTEYIKAVALTAAQYNTITPVATTMYCITDD